MSKKALIIGISGQDGVNLASLLLKKNYIVHGIYRRNLKFLKKKNLIRKVTIFKIKNINVENLKKILKKNYHEIYFLGGQSNVFKSFSKTQETYDSQILPVISIINFIKDQKKKSKFLFASSSEMFGYKKNKNKLKEEDEKNPLSPYALSKMISFEIIKSYREMFKIPVCSAILFNHESELRSKNYVISKLINYINNKDYKNKDKLKFGNINVKRDWGWSLEFMEGCHKILNSKYISDYNIATGKTVSLKEMIIYSFKQKGLNFKKYIKSDKNFIRKYDIEANYADINKIKNKLNWKPKINYKKLINKLLK